MAVTLEQILDKIAEEIIISPHTNINPQLVKDNQKTIKNGIISIGRTNAEKLILFQKDVKANIEDLGGSPTGGETLTSIVNTINDNGGAIENVEINITLSTNGSFSINLASTNPTIDEDITNILSETTTNDDNTQTILNPLNVSQFINVEQQQTIIDPDQANEFLDTHIYELLPDASLRQDRINTFFTEANELLPPTLPEFDITGNTVGGPDGRVDRDANGNWIGSEQYYLDNSITAPQDNPNLQTIDEEEAYITRLNDNAVNNADNSSKTIESLRNRLNDYLKDVDELPAPAVDDRPVYENQSEGYLKFRNLNQGIIIRNTDSEFIEGLNPESQDYLTTGFTVTMWVRFLDKASGGTLFNFGNPTRDETPFGFSLETYVIDGGEEAGIDDGTYLGATVDMTWKDIFQNNNPNNLDFSGTDNNGTPPSVGFFSTTDTERFVRLVVRHPNAPQSDGLNLSKTYSSNVGISFYQKYQDGPPTNMTNTRIPTNFKEWYFICATFNPAIDEDNIITDDVADTDYLNRNPDYWRNNILYVDNDNLQEQFVLNSGVGNKCKVEIISRTDLLRARGYKV